MHRKNRRYYNKLIFIIVNSFFFILSVQELQAQNFSPYFTQTDHQQYIAYLIESGKLKISHPLNQPFHVNELLDSLQKAELKDNKWIRYLKKDLMKYQSGDESLTSSGKITYQADAKYTYQHINDINNNYFGLNTSLTYAWENLGLHYKYTFDERYKSDTNYFGTKGKLGHEIFGRASEAYLEWQGKNICFFIGRMSRNFGLIGNQGLLVSDNPYSYDQIALSFKNKLLSYTAIFTRLNDVYSYDIRDTAAQYTWGNRFLSIHRFDFRLSSKIEFSFSESILFGGKDEFPQLQYINPANIFYFSKMSDRKGYQEQSANSMMSLDLFYKPTDRWTIFAQFLLDDMDFTKSLREIYPDRIGLSAKVIYCDLLPESQISLSYNRISNWTYNTFYTWGNYTFYGKSLGYPVNGVENINLGINLFKFEPFIFNISLKAQQIREQNLDEPFVAVKTEFPIGIPERSFSARLNTCWFPKSYINAGLQMEYICFDNFRNLQNNKESFLNLLLSLRIKGIWELFHED
jgi:hypothetical protein